VELLNEKGYNQMPDTGGLTVTVPGAVDGWSKLLETFGTFDLKELLNQQYITLNMVSCY